jgi:SGNH domain (fused to AT3 domains)
MRVRHRAQYGRSMGMREGWDKGLLIFDSSPMTGCMIPAEWNFVCPAPDPNTLAYFFRLRGKHIGQRPACPLRSRVLIIADQVKARCVVDYVRREQGPLPHRPLQPCPPMKREAAEQATSSINQMLARVQAKWPDSVELLRPVDYWCDTECPVVRDDSVWLYFDQTHFSVAGSIYMGNRASDVFRKFVER